MPNHLTRRDFLKLSCLTTTSLFLASCGINPNTLDAKVPTATNTPEIVNTKKPTNTPDATNTPEPTNAPELRTLRDFADAIGLSIGTSIPTYIHQKVELHPLVAEFNLGIMHKTAWETIHPSPERYDFKDMGRLVRFATSRNMKIQALHLLWEYEAWIPSWLSQGNYSKKDLLLIMEEHITRTVKRHKSEIHIWSVLNEPFHTERDLFWQDNLGPDYEWIEKAFRWAHEASPDSALLLNEYGIEIPGTENYIPSTDEKTYNLIRDLKDKNVPIHGIGFQMHLSGTNFLEPQQIEKNLESLGKNIQKYKQLDIDVYVTEFDLNMHGISGTQEERFSLHGNAVGKIFETSLSAGVRTFTIFGLSDRDSWLLGSHSDPAPLLWDDNLKPKPAYYAIRDVLQEEYKKVVK